jgi:membrane-bound lytic murein transglycosylase D
MALIPGKEYFQEQKQSKYYQIRYGDTLSDIARRFGTTLEMLLAINNISNEHYIRQGMTIRIPDEKEGSIILAREGSSQTKTDTQIITQPSEKIFASIPKVPEENSSKAEEKAAKTFAPVFTNGKNMADLDIEFIQTQNPPVGYIRVEPEETLGHYADWLQIKTQSIRDWNNLSFGRTINLNQRIKLKFDQITPDEFNRLRLEYHRGIEEDFFMNYAIVGTITHQVQTGENIWYLCHYVYNLPYWLIVDYNKDIDFNQLKVGNQLIIPEITAKDDVSI